MRISVVTGFFLPVPPVAGGAMEKAWFRLSQEFAVRGHAVTLLSRAWPGFPQSETIGGVSIRRVPGFRHRRRTSVNLLLDALWGLRVLRRLPPADVVACNTVTLPVYLPRVRPSAGRTVAVLARMPKGHARFYGAAPRVLAISEAVGRAVLRENPRLAPRLRVIPLPIDWPRLHDGAAGRGGPGPLTIGYAGRLNPEKGLELLLGAARRLRERDGLPSWRLRLVGPQEVAEGGGGPAFLARLRTLAAESGAEVSIEPPVYDPSALARIYRAFDLFCYPSLAEQGEALGVAPIEAMAAGAVPVVSDLECFRDFLVPGGNGEVFDHRAPDREVRLAEALAGLLGDPVRRAALAGRAVQDSRRFDYPTVASALLEDFGKLSGGSPGS